jgi:hypothetical protein
MDIRSERNNSAKDLDKLSAWVTELEPTTLGQLGQGGTGPRCRDPGWGGRPWGGRGRSVPIRGAV